MFYPLPFSLGVPMPQFSIACKRSENLVFGHYPFIIPVSFVLLILDKSYLLLSSNHDFSFALYRQLARPTCSSHHGLAITFASSPLPPPQNTKFVPLGSVSWSTIPSDTSLFPRFCRVRDTTGQDSPADHVGSLSRVVGMDQGPLSRLALQEAPP